MSSWIVLIAGFLFSMNRLTINLRGSGYSTQGKDVEVHLCKDPTSMDVFVRKKTFKSELTDLRLHQCRRECMLQASLSHPNIVPIYCGIETDDAILILMDYYDQGDLFEEVLGPSGSAKDAKDAVTNVLHPILDALSYLHERDIMHRDIKLENILRGRDGKALLTDFGFAINSREERPVTRLGTMGYMSKEVLNALVKRDPAEYKDREDLRYGPEADVYAFGVLAYEVLCGTSPFDAEDIKKMLAQIEKGPRFPDSLSDQAVNFLRQCLYADASKRGSVRTLLAHPFIMMFVNTGGWKASRADVSARPAPSAPASRDNSVASTPTTSALHVSTKGPTVKATISSMSQSGSTADLSGSLHVRPSSSVRTPTQSQSFPADASTSPVLGSIGQRRVTPVVDAAQLPSLQARPGTSSGIAKGFSSLSVGISKMVNRISQVSHKDPDKAGPSNSSPRVGGGNHVGWEGSAHGNASAVSIPRSNLVPGSAAAIAAKCRASQSAAVHHLQPLERPANPLLLATTPGADASVSRCTSPAPLKRTLAPVQPTSSAATGMGSPKTPTGGAGARAGVRFGGGVGGDKHPSLCVAERQRTKSMVGAIGTASPKMGPSGPRLESAAIGRTPDRPSAITNGGSVRSTAMRAAKSYSTLPHVD